MHGPAALALALALCSAARCRSPVAARPVAIGRAAACRWTRTLAANRVWQLFYALEKKEEQLAAAQSEKEKLSTELNSARGNPQTTFIEIHHHNDISDNSDDDDDHGKGAAAPVS
jgi:hypothetical protein